MMLANALKLLSKFAEVTRQANGSRHVVTYYAAVRDHWLAFRGFPADPGSHVYAIATYPRDPDKPFIEPWALPRGVPHYHCTLSAAICHASRKHYAWQGARKVEVVTGLGSVRPPTEFVAVDIDGKWISGTDDELHALGRLAKAAAPTGNLAAVLDWVTEQTGQEDEHRILLKEYAGV
jgi:hypothetical protein